MADIERDEEERPGAKAGEVRGKLPHEMNSRDASPANAEWPESTLRKMVRSVATGVKSYVEQKQREAQLRKQDAQRKEFTEFVSTIQRFKDTINPTSLKAILEFESLVEGNPEALARFARDERAVNLRTWVETRADFLVKDAQRSRPNCEFETSSGVLFSAIGENAVSPILTGITRRYTISNAGNSMAAGIMAGRRNYGGAAIAVANAAQIGAHNGEARNIFTGHIRNIRYAAPPGTMSDRQIKYIRACYRYLFLSIGDASIVRRALFSLIYNGGTTPPRLPVYNSKFSGNLHAEFHNSFLSYMWTPAQAAVQMDSLASSSKIAAELLDGNDMSGVMKRLRDDVPSPGEIMEAIKAKKKLR